MTKNRPIVVAGLPKCGKTTLICALICEALAKSHKIAGLKPFDAGILRRNASEIPSDGELFCQYMEGEPLENLVLPYSAHEDYPIEMAFRRDGIRVNWKVLQERLKMLSEHYQTTLVESPGSLLTPLSEDKQFIEWAAELDAEFIWVINPIQDDFTQNLAEINLLKDRGFPFRLVFNNVDELKDQDLAFYIWEKIEQIADQQAEGMVPHVKTEEGLEPKVGEKIAENVPGLLDCLQTQEVKS